MPNTTIYHWGDNYLQIKLGNRTAPRIKALYWGEFLITLGMSTIFMLQSFPIAHNVVHMMAAAGSAVLYLLASYRFISRTFYTEELWLDDMFLTIISSTPFKRKLDQYDWANIGQLHYIGKDSKTDHPLKGQCYDYFGFETQEKLIQNIHEDGNLYFNYGGYRVRFAKGVYSWNAEEMVGMMQLFAGNKLHLGIEWENILQDSEADS
jgi:hypothetical protein